VPLLRRLNRKEEERGDTDLGHLWLISLAIDDARRRGPACLQGPMRSQEHISEPGHETNGYSRSRYPRKQLNHLRRSDGADRQNGRRSVRRRTAIVELARGEARMQKPNRRRGAQKGCSARQWCAQCGPPSPQHSGHIKRNRDGPPREKIAVSARRRASVRQPSISLASHVSLLPPARLFEPSRQPTKASKFIHSRPVEFRGVLRPFACRRSATSASLRNDRRTVLTAKDRRAQARFSACASVISAHRTAHRRP